MRNYRDLLVWEKAHSLTLCIYRDTQAFPKEERFGITSQIRRAASSIGANLAEGCGRRSDREMARFVQIAMGSAADVRITCCCAETWDCLRRRSSIASAQRLRKS